MIRLFLKNKKMSSSKFRGVVTMGRERQADRRRDPTEGGVSYCPCAYSWLGLGAFIISSE